MESIWTLRVYDAPMMWDSMGIICTFDKRYDLSMALTRIHVGLTSQQVKILEKLTQKLGLDKTNTIRYCVMRVAEQESIDRGRTGHFRVEPEQ